MTTNDTTTIEESEGYSEGKGLSFPEVSNNVENILIF